MPRNVPVNDLGLPFNQMANESDRACAIVAGAMIENELALAIMSRMRPLGSTIQEKIFEGYGPLSTCAAKIDIAYALGIIGDSVRKDLIIINRIRNKFAHRMDIMSFDHKDVTKLCDELKGHAQSIITLEAHSFSGMMEQRKRFLICAVILRAGLVYWPKTSTVFDYSTA